MKIAKKFQKLFHSDCDMKTCWNTRANSNSHTKCHAQTIPNSQTNCHAQTIPNSQTNCQAQTIPNSHTKCHAQTIPNSHTKCHAQTIRYPQTKREVKPRQRFLQIISKEDGNVESALVLIPMLVLFLIGVQVIVATNIRNADLALAQGDAAARAISHEYQSGDELLEVGGRIEKIQLLVTHRSHTLPQIVPGLVELMGGAPSTDVVGIAVVEPSND